MVDLKDCGFNYQICGMKIFCSLCTFLSSPFPLLPKMSLEILILEDRGFPSTVFWGCSGRERVNAVPVQKSLWLLRCSNGFKPQAAQLCLKPYSLRRKRTLESMLNHRFHNWHMLNYHLKKSDCIVLQNQVFTCVMLIKIPAHDMSIILE